MTTCRRKTIEFDEGWSIVQTEINKLKEILEGHSEPRSNDEICMMINDTIYNMCTQPSPHGYSQQLYYKYRETCEDYICSRVFPLLREKHDEFMLRELVTRWSNQDVMLRWLLQAFSCLDLNFAVKNSLPSLEEVSSTIFTKMVYEEFKCKAKDAVIALINQEREGEQIDRALLKNVVGIYVDIGMGELDFYVNDFETDMLSCSAAYYFQKAPNWIAENSCPAYVLKAEDCLRKEKERVSHYLHSNSEQKLLETVENELLIVYSSQLLENEHSGCRTLLRDDKVDDLARIYRLFSRIVKGLDPIATMFRQHVTAEGMVLVQQAEDVASTEVFLRNVIALHDKSMAYVTDCFMNHKLFHKALNDAFEVFCNKSVAGGSRAELLASYCDNILKKGGSEKLSDEAIEETLDKVMKLVSFIRDKNHIEALYRRRLSRRLLFDESANHVHERLMISKLKQQHGRDFTWKMEGMVNDLALAKENHSQFNEYLSNNPAADPGIDLMVSVLTTGIWPSYKSSDLRLPKEMVKCVQAFKEFYQEKYKHRRLTWIHSLGTCNVIRRFDQQITNELIVGTYQAAALELFNDADQLSYSDVKALLNLDDEDAVRILCSLSCGKYKILTKEPPSKTVSETDNFHFNANFSDERWRIRIPLPPVEERKKVVEDVEKDRRYEIDAFIVRVMKSRKVLGHQQLITECTEQLSRRFKPDIKAIKKRIEDLISREFLERDQKDRNLYRYLA